MVTDFVSHEILTWMCMDLVLANLPQLDYRGLLILLTIIIHYNYINNKHYFLYFSRLYN
jgi:hypothetical protein